MTVALTRAVAAFRIVALGYVVILVVSDHDHYSRPGLGWAALTGMAVWTALTVVAYRPGARSQVLLSVDIAVAIGAILLTLAVEPQSRIDAGAPTLPAAWVAAPVMMAAILGGPWLGGLAGALMSGADVVERGAVTQHTFNGIVLLLMTGFVGGYIVRLGQRAEAVIDAAARRDAATAERDRLAREIHDSALQVLALVARRGNEIGGESAELARLAAEQEVALRRLVASTPATDVAATDLDLRDLVTAMQSATVTVATPAAPVVVPHEAGLAIVAAVAEAVANVERHAGAGAKAWVLLDAEPDAIVVSVRDDGVGIAAGRLVEAADSGRLGVAQSIVGRIESLGGTADVISGPGAGTEVEIRVPR